MEELLALLDEVKPTTRYSYKARCPAHDDPRPSLSIKLEADDRILLHCFGGCTTESILERLGLGFKDLYNDN
jgi:putative DNA primase/helicase